MANSLLKVGGAALTVAMLFGAASTAFAQGSGKMKETVNPSQASRASTISAYTQDMVFFPLETAGCNLQDGKTHQDYAAVMKLFNAHLDKLV